MPKIPPGRLESYGGAIARAIGTRNFGILAGMMALWIAVNVFSNAVDGTLQKWGPLARMAPLVLVAGLLGWAARKAARNVRLKVRQPSTPPVCEGLILFLAPPGPDLPRLPAIIADPAIRGRLGDPAVRASFQGSWRMPMEFVASHLGRVRKIVVLASADSPKKQDGTIRHLPAFLDLLRTLLPEPKQVEILTAAMFDSAWDSGLDFEDLERLVDALQLVLRTLEAKGMAPYEIMIDVTGALKIPSVAGAAVALGQGRRFQYVSMRDYGVRTYDMEYDPDAG